MPLNPIFLFQSRWLFLKPKKRKQEEQEPEAEPEPKKKKKVKSTGAACNNPQRPNCAKSKFVQNLSKLDLFIFDMQKIQFSGLIWILFIFDMQKLRKNLPCFEVFACQK